jgi:hypothetical protein
VIGVNVRGERERGEKERRERERRGEQANLQGRKTKMEERKIE